MWSALVIVAGLIGTSALPLTSTDTSDDVQSNNQRKKRSEWCTHSRSVVPVRTTRAITLITPLPISPTAGDWYVHQSPV